MIESKITLELSREEAVVFFAWLSRFNQSGSSKFEDQAEQRILWDMEAMLESTLVEPLEPDYDILLANARATVRDPIE